MSTQRGEKRRREKKPATETTMEDLHNTMDRSFNECSFQEIVTDNLDGFEVKAKTQAELARAVDLYTDHHHHIQAKLMKKVRENDPAFLDHFKQVQNRSDQLLVSYGSNYNDIISLDAKCHKEIGAVFVAASAEKLKASDDFNWVRFKQNVRDTIKANARAYGMPAEPMFVNAFPTAMLMARKSRLLLGDFTGLGVGAIEALDSDRQAAKVAAKAVRRNNRKEIADKRKTATSEPTLAPQNMEDDSRLLAKLERRIVEVEKRHDRRPMPMAKLACDPASFVNTVENMSKLSFLLQQGTLLYFVDPDDGEAKVISQHNAKRRGMTVPDVGAGTRYVHYDTRTYEHWIQKYDCKEHFLANL